MANRVEFTIALAHFLFNQARILVGVGLGETEGGTDLGYPGELENIPSDTETFRWADACIKFIRYVALQLGPAIEEYYTREGTDALEQALLEITNNDEDSI